MRRFNYSFGYLVLTVLFCFRVGSLFGQSKDSLPDFTFVSPDGLKVSAADFDNGKPLVVFYFDPTCAHCKEQAEWVAFEIDKFQWVDLLWVAWAATDGIPDFNDQYFPQTENVFYAIDTEAQFDDLFGFCQIPTVFAYSAEGQLLRKFKGGIRVSKLLKTLGLR